MEQSSPALISFTHILLKTVLSPLANAHPAPSFIDSAPTLAESPRQAPQHNPIQQVVKAGFQQTLTYPEGL
jgi:hypothetical protein